MVKGGISEVLEKYKFKEATFGLDITEFIRNTVFWIVFLLIEAIVFYYSSLPSLFNFYVYYVLPKILDFIYGVYILVFGFWIAYLLRERIQRENFEFSGFISKIVYYIMLYMITVSVLPKWGIDNKIFLDTFRFLVLGASFGIGISIGIGLGLILKKYIEKEIEKK
jgi:hypothetical protein